MLLALLASDTRAAPVGRHAGQLLRLPPAQAGLLRCAAHISHAMRHFWAADAARIRAVVVRTCTCHACACCCCCRLCACARTAAARYKVVKQLGDGTYGNVWKAINRQTNEVVSCAMRARGRVLANTTGGT